jgi:hypothetical protein
LRRHANKPPPPPGAPGIFALQESGALRTLFQSGGFTEIEMRTVDQSISLSSADEAVQMIQEAFGLYRSIIGDQPVPVQEAAWSEVRQALGRLESESRLRATGRFHVAAGRKPPV